MKKLMRLFVFTGLLLIGGGLSACSESAGEPDAAAGPAGYPYNITTTVGMITDIVRNVAGEHAVVTGLIGEGIDPHLYKPTRGDVVKLNDAAIVFYNGLMLEGKMGDVLVSAARKGKPVYAVTQTILEQGEYVITDAAQHYESRQQYRDAINAAMASSAA